VTVDLTRREATCHREHKELKERVASLFSRSQRERRVQEKAIVVIFENVRFLNG